MSEQKRVNFNELRKSDLIVDAVYEGGHRGNAGDDPIGPLLGVGNQGGFRYIRNSKTGNCNAVVLYSSLADTDWPDFIDLQTGTFIYYGDNKKVGAVLLQPRGNRLLQEIFSYSHGSREERMKVPPVFIFTKAIKGRDVMFRGLAVPGGNTLTQTEDLMAIWKSKNGVRFQNYRAIFTMLNEPVIKRAWLNDLRAGSVLSPSCPKGFRLWVDSRSYAPLFSTKTVQHRKPKEQQPQTSEEQKIISKIYSRFKSNPHQFEKCAASIVRMMDANVMKLDLTRPWLDGGRDALGEYRIGPINNSITVDFAMEAKCYGPKNSVGIKETSRLISRLRFRQFGVLVTTSYLNEQAYKEIKADAHPIIILAATDIAKVLILHGYGDEKMLGEWLDATCAVYDETTSFYELNSSHSSDRDNLMAADSANGTVSIPNK